MCELISNMVMYAKQQWKKTWEEQFSTPGKMLMLAVATHHPTWLAPDENLPSRVRKVQSPLQVHELVEFHRISRFLVEDLR